MIDHAHHSTQRAVACIAVCCAVLLAGCGGGGAGKRKGIITMAPHLTETVFALGQGRRVIARGSYDDWPPPARRLPSVGGYIDPNFEQITMLSPELLILPGEHAEVTQYAELQQLPVLNVNMDSFATIDTGIETIGIALGCEKEADRLRARIKSEQAALRSALNDVQRVSAFIITSRQAHDLNTLHTVGATSFVSELVELAGADNIYSDTPKNYLEASKETLVMRAPDVIIEFHAGRSLTDRQRQAYRNDWNALSMVPAVKNGRVYLIVDSHGTRPGPRIVNIALRVAQHLHPQAVVDL